MRLFASLRDRPSFTAFTTNDQTIQLPAYASRAIHVTQKIGRGETLMVTGFSDRSASAGRSGTFDADLPLPDGIRTRWSSASTALPKAPNGRYGRGSGCRSEEKFHDGAIREFAGHLERRGR